MQIEGHSIVMTLSIGVGPGVPGRTPMWRCARPTPPCTGPSGGEGLHRCLRSGLGELKIGFPGARSAASGYPVSDMLSPLRLSCRSPWQPFVPGPPAVAHQTVWLCRSGADCNACRGR